MIVPPHAGISLCARWGGAIQRGGKVGEAKARNHNFYSLLEDVMNVQG